MKRRQRDAMLKEWATQHAKLESAIIKYVDALSDKGAARLAKVIGALTTTNCWWAEYHIRHMVRDALTLRAQRLAAMERTTKP